MGPPLHQLGPWNSLAITTRQVVPFHGPRPCKPTGGLGSVSLFRSPPRYTHKPFTFVSGLSFSSSYCVKKANLSTIQNRKALLGLSILESVSKILTTELFELGRHILFCNTNANHANGM